MRCGTRERGSQVGSSRWREGEVREVWVARVSLEGARVRLDGASG